MTRQFIFSSTTFLALTALAILSSCDRQPKVKIVEKWDNGKNRIVHTYDNPDDTLSYLHEWFFENGQIATKGYLLNGKQEGLWEWWFENGNRKDEANFKNGFYIKERKHWREDGTLKQIEIITGQCPSDYCCDGKEIHYTEKEIKLIEYTRQNGARDGVGLTYFPNGKIKKKFTYIKGQKNGMSYDYFMNGQIEVKGNFIDDKEEGVWIEQDSVGKIKRKYSYINGKMEGMNYEYFPNGKIEVEGEYVNDKEEGTWTWRDSTGRIEGYKVYKKGEIISIKEARAK